MIKFIPALMSLRATTVKGPARGILFQITECFGAVPRKNLNNLIRNLDDKGKRDLSVSGVRFGVHTVFMPDLLKPKAIWLLAILWRVFNEEELFSFRRITLAPFLVISGYGLVLFGIMKKQ